MSDLATINQPHVTLYLTLFDTSVLEALEAQLSAVLANLTQCDIPLNSTTAQGSYGMWNVLNTACLQFASDSIVNATYTLAVPNQPVPAWYVNVRPSAIAMRRI